MNIDERLRLAGHALRATVNPTRPPLGGRRRVPPTSRLAFATSVLTLTTLAIIAVAQLPNSRPAGSPTPPSTTVASSGGTVSNYIGLLTGDWLERQRSTGARLELWSPNGSVPEPGRVVDQDPPAGTPTTDSTVVRLRIDSPDIDLPGELPTGLSGTNPTSGYWRIVATPLANPSTAVDADLVAITLLRTSGSTHRMTYTRASLTDAPTPNATDAGQANSLYFGVQGRTTETLRLIDADDRPIGAPRVAEINVNGERLLVWVVASEVPPGTRIRAETADGTITGSTRLR